MVSQQAVLQVEGEHCLNRTQVYLRLLWGVWVDRFRIGRLDSLIDEPANPLLLFIVPLSHEVTKQLSKVVVSDYVILCEILVTNGTLVHPIDALRDAIFAERVTTLCDVWVIECLETDDALSKLANDIVYADLDGLIVLRLALLKPGLLHWDIWVVDWKI